MAHDRLSATDTAFLRVEKPNQPQHVGSLSFFEAAPLRDDQGRIPIEELRLFIEGRLHRVPRLRQRLMEVPFGQGRPIWVDDDRFDISYHVRLTSLPHPGDDAQMLELVGRLQSQALDRNRPLWELWFVDGVDDDRVGLVIKTHHALGDGLANVDLGMALLDLERRPPHAEPVPTWEPRPAPAPARLLADSVAETFAPSRVAGLVRSLATHPGEGVTYAANVGRTVVEFARPPRKASWNTPVTRHRRWTMARVPLDVARRTRTAAGCTLNDVVLAACTGALRAFMLAHDEAVPERVLKAMVPVSRRAESERGTMDGNRISLIVVDLPVYEADPVTRLELIHAQTVALKGSGLVEGAQAIIELADQVPFVAAPLTRFVSGHIPMNLVVTNIPGPPIPLYLRGAQLLETFPYVEVVDRQGLTIAVVSYGGQFLFGLTSDRDVIEDLGLLSEAIEKEFGELEAAVVAHHG